MKRGHSLRAIFAVPALLALLSLVGLVAALTGDGVPDIIAWIMLAMPVAAVFWAMKARRS